MKAMKISQYHPQFFFIVLTCLLHFVSHAQKHLYLANDDHSDFMWTANEAHYDTAFVHMLDYYLDQIDATISNADDFQTRFNCDGSYWLRAYEKYRSPAQYQRLISRVRSGHISSPLNFLVSTYGAQPTEAILRGMYHAGQLERDHNLRFPLAVCMENQTLPLGLSSLWAGAGAHYSWRGVCGCATRFSNESLAQRKNQLYHYEGLDGRKVIMKWYSRVLYNGRTLGGYAECRRERDPKDPVRDMGYVVDDMDKMCDTLSATSPYPFNVAGAFGYGWDDLATFNAPDFIAAAQRYSNTSHRVRVSNEVDFFEEVKKRYPILPVERVTYGNEWDTYCVSMNETTAKVRRSTEKLRAAEAMAAVVATKGIDFSNALKPVRDQAWEAFGLYWEHDWTADGPVSRKDRANWQIKLQKQIARYTDTLHLLSKTALANQIAAGKHARFYVFNPLSWTRSDVVDVESTEEASRIIDLATGKEVAGQLIYVKEKKYLRFRAEDIPSVGYKVYELRKGKPAFFQRTITVKGEYVKNKFFRLRVRPSGVLTEWYDSLTNGRSLIKAIDGKYVNDLGTKNLAAGILSIENEGPMSVTIKAVSNDPLPHTTRVTVYANASRIDIENTIQANFGDLKTWAFSFDLSNPTTHHEELGAVLTVKKEMRGGHYANEKGRYDWQTFNHFADLSETNYGVTISNLDCSFFTLGNSTPDSLWENSSQLKALAGGQTDPYNGLSQKVKDTVMMGIYRQNGDKEFHYQFALASHARAYDPVHEMKLALEHQNPLVTEFIQGNSKEVSEKKYSFIHTDDPSVLLWSIKPAEEGITNGWMTRWWNFSSQPTTTSLSWALPIHKAWQTSHLETNEQLMKPQQGALTIGFQPFQMNTYRLISDQRK